MNFDQIMSKITSDLTGDRSQDIDYLKAQMEKYEGHEMGKEICRACARIMVEILPADKKMDLDNTFKNQITAWKATLEEVRFNRYKKNYDQALELAESLVQRLRDMTEAGMFVDDEVSEYHTFWEPYESILYDFFNKPTKTVRKLDGIPAAEVYLEYGSILIDFNRISDAQEALSEAIKWNPVSSEIAFEYAETFKIQGNMEAFYKRSLEMFQYAFRPKALARCYRNLGYYFTEKKLWQEAMDAYILSLQYDQDSKNAQLELYYIGEQANGKIKKPGLKELRSFCKKYGVPLGADEDVVGLAFSIGRQCIADKNTAAAGYFLRIAYDLTEAEEIKKMMDELPKA